MKRSPIKSKVTVLAGALRTNHAGLAAAPKTTKCRICRSPFVKRSMTHTACLPACAQEVARRKRVKAAAAAARADRADLVRRKEANKRRPELIAEAQQAFNAFIRARDAGRPCICCGKPFEPQKPGGAVDAGHYLSRGSAPHLRFDERNCHAQRKNCNRPGGTTRAAFRIGMEARIGLEALEALECDQTSRDWTHDDLRAIRAVYRAKLKELKAEI